MQYQNMKLLFVSLLESPESTTNLPHMIIHLDQPPPKHPERSKKKMILIINQQSSQEICIYTQLGKEGKGNEYQSVTLTNNV